MILRRKPEPTLFAPGWSSVWDGLRLAVPADGSVNPRNVVTGTIGTNVHTYGGETRTPPTEWGSSIAGDGGWNYCHHADPALPFLEYGYFSFTASVWVEIPVAGGSGRYGFASANYPAAALGLVPWALEWHDSGYTNPYGYLSGGRFVAFRCNGSSRNSTAVSSPQLNGGLFNVVQQYLYMSNTALWVNGVYDTTLVFSNLSTRNCPGSEVHVGASGGYFGNWAGASPCRVLDVKLWSRQLSSAEILYQYEHPWEPYLARGNLAWHRGARAGASFRWLPALLSRRAAA